jgi:hypothetical protein
MMMQQNIFPNRLYLFIFLSLLPYFSKAQLSITAKLGELYSFSKKTNKGNPSPYFRVKPFVTDFGDGFLGLNFGYVYKRFSYDISIEYTGIGAASYDETVVKLCPECDDSRIFTSAYAVPIVAFPIRVGYHVLSKYRLDVFAKLGCFLVSRRGDPQGFAKHDYFGPYGTKDIYIHAPNGKPFGYTSYNLQADLNLVYTLGSNKKHGITLDLIYNQGLKKLAEDKYIVTIHPLRQTYTNYVTRRGSYIGFNIGYTQVFQNTRSKKSYRLSKRTFTR